MARDIWARQAEMRRRQEAKLGTTRMPPRGYDSGTMWGNPVDYSHPVGYSSDVAPMQYCARVNGVYLLAEAGRFYVGQSIDVYARFSSHRLRPVCGGFCDPRGVVLASIPFRDDWTLSENAHVRLNAHARFVTAALSLNLPLVNVLSAYKRDKLARLFPDISRERERLEKGLEILCQIVSPPRES